MEKDYLLSIRHLFDAQQQLLPIPTYMASRLRGGSRQLKCVIFDIYGTLLISSSGDIDKLRLSPSYILESFSKCGIKIISPSPDKTAEDIIIKYKQTINELQGSENRNNCGHPEIDIREVWRRLIQELYREKLIDKPWIREVELLAVHFEILSNPVYPMPSMKETILRLHERRIPLGIISNAQFYTPVIMNYFLTGEVGGRETIDYFDPDLTVFSYREKLGKPELVLFEKVLDRCQTKYGLQNHEILYVGNDMLKDIYPAQQLRMRTALFAGDARSLRLRTETIPGNCTPDYTVNSLKQITRLFL
ncbi:MAG: HAD family hydrolase [Victivallaceae bacterium]|nr:HAD family hydrolase [Victivallaceae bacterium]